MPLPTPPTEWAEVDDAYGLYWWMEADWTALLDGAQLRGSDTIIPGSPGRYVNPRTIDETTYICPGYMYGDRSFDGDTVTGDANVRSNLRANLAFWRGFIAAPEAPSSPLRVLTIHDDNDTAWAGYVIIDRNLSLTPVTDDGEQSPYCFKVVVRVTVPAGELVAVGS